MAGESMLQLAGEAALYSCLASSGFVIAVLVAWFILSRLAPGSRPVGNFGKVRVLVLMPAMCRCLNRICSL
jgi:hypothetical protein